MVFTGFGKGKTRLNMQALANSLRWGPDNRIWGATAGTGGSIRRPDQPESEEISINGRDFSFDPKTLEDVFIHQTGHRFWEEEGTPFCQQQQQSYQCGDVGAVMDPTGQVCLSAASAGRHC